MKAVGEARPASPPRRGWRSGLAAAAAAVLAASALVTVNAAPAVAATVDLSAWYVLVTDGSAADGAAVVDVRVPLVGRHRRRRRLR